MSDCYKVIYCDLVVRQCNVSMFNCEVWSRSYQRNTQDSSQQQQTLCCAPRMHLPYPHNLINLKQSVYIVAKKSLAFPIKHCGEDPTLPVEATPISLPQESLVYRAFLQWNTQGTPVMAKEGQQYVEPQDIQGVPFSCSFGWAMTI